MITFIVIVSLLVFIIPVLIFIASPKDVLKKEYPEEKAVNVVEDYIEEKP